MRLELARACLSDADAQTRRAGLALLLDSESAEADQLLANSVADPSEIVWHTARDVLLNRYPWLALDPITVRPVPESALSGRYASAWARFRQAIARMIQDTRPPSAVLARWTSMPGAAPDVVEELWANGMPERAEELARHVARLTTRPSGQRQILLAPTYRCNLSCSYCYAREFDKRAPGDMTTEDLEAALSWAASQGVDSVLLGGGEPTMYPAFPELLRLARGYAIRVHLTSNCLYPEGLRQIIVNPGVAELVAHYDHERVAAEGPQRRLFLDNVEAARASGVEIRIRYTLTERSCTTEWAPVLELARRLAIPQVNYATAFRGAEDRNLYFHSLDAAGGNDGLLEGLLTTFYDDATSLGLKLHLSKPLPLCAFSPDTLRRLLCGGALRQACPISCEGFTRNLTINPDLSTFPCSAIPMRGPGIQELPVLDELGGHFEPTIRRLLAMPYRESCANCALWYRGFCQGACLAEVYSTLVGSEQCDT